jgi:hypothetical protein
LVSLLIASLSADYAVSGARSESLLNMIGRKDMDVNEYERISNISFRLKLRNSL